MISALLRHCFPGHCLLCHVTQPSGPFLCARCQLTLPRIAIGCYQCGIPVATEGMCAACLDGKRAFDLAVIPFAYAPPLSALIIRAKQQPAGATTATMAALCATHIRLHYHTPLPDALIPVPNADPWWRWRKRNLATLLAYAIGSKLAIPVYAQHVVKTRRTARQSSLTIAGRQRNVRGAFAARQPLTVKHIAIVDDVVTTGATVHAVAKALRLLSPQLKITVWAIARTPIGG